MNRYDVIIAGSGLGGLLCGIMLAREGKGVCILEKEAEPGGCLRSFKRNGILFDTGVHYIGSLGEGQVLDRYFRYFGIAGKLRLEQLNPDGFDIIAHRDRQYPLAQGFDNFVEQLLPFFPAERGSLERYVKMLQEVAGAFPLYNLEMPGNHREDPWKSRSAFEFYRSCSPEDPASAPEHFPLSSVLAGNNFLYAGHPGKTPLHIAALINHSFISGAWRLVGGSMQLAERLTEQLETAGGVIITGRKITRITRDKEGFMVKTEEGEEFQAKRLISDIHPAVTLGMLEASGLRRVYTERILGLENTVSVFTLYITLKEKTFLSLDRNIYYHDGPDVWKCGEPNGWPHFFLLHTPSEAGMGKFARSAVIMTFMDTSEVKAWDSTATGKRGGSYLEFKSRKADQLLTLVEKKFPGFRSCIQAMESSTPLTWRDYTGTPGGSMYGLQKDHNRILETTVLPETKIPGLYFTGQSTNLHGVLGVTIGAVQTCGEILGLEYLLKKIRNEG
jgi:all-trans-retinol 13,14-reductase